MPTNKNALARIKVLDELLADRNHNYSVKDLNRICTERLREYSDANFDISLRQTQKDINFIEFGPFEAELERFSATNLDGGSKVADKQCVRYANSGYSIFKKEMSDDEKYLLDHVLNMLGQFDGLPEFAQLNALAKGLDIHDHRKIICLSENPLRDTNIFGSIYSTIVHHQVIRLKYHIFTGPTIERSVFVHPYLLKEYNRRWYLFCSAFDTGKILNFALDRINSIEPMPSMEYKDCPDELVERFEDIIGVTFHEGCPVETITFWVSDKSLGYVKTKPLHESQKNLALQDQDRLHNDYPTLSGGSFFSIDCIRNYELIRELSSFGKELIVLTPQDLRKEIITQVEDMLETYTSII